MTDDEIIQEAVKRAQEEARSNGLEIGAIVAHPSDNMTYRLLDVKDGIATVGLSAEESKTGRVVIKQFPFAELFDPNVAKFYVVCIREREKSN